MYRGSSNSARLHSIALPVSITAMRRSGIYYVLSEEFSAILRPLNHY
jgi:hypothetical protein